jgi:ribosome-binding factor A
VRRHSRENEGVSAGHRHERLEQLVRDELEAILRDEAADPALESVRVTAVTVSVDYRHARVHVALEPERRDAQLHALVRATPFLRARLAEAIDLKRVPDLRFIDES